jgi:hypothetical protein
MNRSRNQIKRFENVRMRAALLTAVAVAWSTVAMAQDRLVVSPRSPRDWRTRHACVRR